MLSSNNKHLPTTLKRKKRYTATHRTHIKPKRTRRQKRRGRKRDPVHNLKYWGHLYTYPMRKDLDGLIETNKIACKKGHRWKFRYGQKTHQK